MELFSGFSRVFLLSSSTFDFIFMGQFSGTPLVSPKKHFLRLQ
jgi:hypothetical protein